MKGNIVLFPNVVVLLVDINFKDVFSTTFLVSKNCNRIFFSCSVLIYLDIKLEFSYYGKINENLGFVNTYGPSGSSIHNLTLYFAHWYGSCYFLDLI